MNSSFQKSSKEDDQVWKDIVDSISNNNWAMYNLVGKRKKRLVLHECGGGGLPELKRYLSDSCIQFIGLKIQGTIISEDDIEKIEKAGFKATRSLSQGIEELVSALPLLKRTQFANI